MSIPAAARTLLRKSPTVAQLSNRSVLSVVGSQASEFLQGLLTTSVSGPESGPFYSSVLNAQGRVLHDIFVYTQTNPNGQRGFLIEHDAPTSEIPDLLTVLKRFVLRSKVRIRNVSDEYDVWAAWGSEKEDVWETERRWKWARSGAVEPVWGAEERPWGAEDYLIRDRRAVGMGLRRLVRKGDLPQEAVTHDVASPSTYLLHRILHGVPEGISEIPYASGFPLESNLDIMGALDFRKGCYVGQELTVRTYHTGVVRKRILPVMISSTDGSLYDGPVSTEIRPLSKSSVQVRPRGTSKLLNSVNGVGLALLRLEHLEGVENGHLDLQINSTGGDHRISHWWPDWWPRQPEATL